MIYCLKKSKEEKRKRKKSKALFSPQFSSVQFSRSVMSDSLRPHEPQHARPPCPSPTPGVYPNPCPLGRWCHPTTSSLSSPFSSCLQSFIEVIATVSSNTFGWFCLLLNILKIEWRIRTLLCLDFFTFNIKTERLTQVDFVWTSRSFFSYSGYATVSAPFVEKTIFSQCIVSLLKVVCVFVLWLLFRFFLCLVFFRSLIMIWLCVIFFGIWVS